MANAESAEALYNSLATKQDKRDFHKLAEKAGDPDVANQLASWSAEDSGRSGHADMQIYGGDPMRLHIAQVFPLTREQMESVIVFADGNSITQRVKKGGDPEKYKNLWSMKSTTIHYPGVYGSIEEIIDSYSFRNFGEAEKVLDSRNPADVPQLKEALQTGYQMAQQIKEEAEEGRKQSKQNILELFPAPEESDEEEKDIS